ncbi:MAG: polymerase subunit gamma/tau [Clostridia bacterium]|jgi:DNA polymerase-3 subunit gamma/tau|nr:polymerase subunit gamma/tau [Clostridia bacterium]MDN5323779.1 polymerase subunit gamma/tau [Clostridia bacterium]
MSYIALYRAFRPKEFSEVVGQEHISKTLKNALVNNRVAHAYLFCGPRGTGKTSSAKILAKAVNCLNLDQGEPCNECPNCLAINTGNFLDVFEIDAASNRGIDEIRDLRDKVKFAPSQGKTKVYIIDEVHMLTSEAFNALLKTLEEPPAHVLFVLATTEPQKIPLTILSRCQRFDFRKISTKEIREHLMEIVRKEGITVSDNALNVIARKAAGGMRDAISILDQCIAFAGNSIDCEHVEKVLGTLGEEQILEMSQAIVEGDIGSVISKINESLQAGKDVKQIVRDLIEYFRQVMLLKLSQSEELITISPEMLSKAKEQVHKLSTSFLGHVILKLTEVERELRWSSQPQILLEAGLVEVILKINSDQEGMIINGRTTSEPEVKEKINQITKKQEQSMPVRAGIPVNFSEIKRKWPEILDKVKQNKITTHAFLIAAEPVNIDEQGCLILNFKEGHKFHRDKIFQHENRQLVEMAIKEVLGMEIKLTYTKEEEETNNNSTQNSSALDKALQLFGGKIVEIKD